MRLRSNAMRVLLGIPVSSQDDYAGTRIFLFSLCPQPDIL